MKLIQIPAEGIKVLDQAGRSKGKIMLIVKGETGIAFNPQYLQIVYRNKNTGLGADYKGIKSYEEIANFDEYYIQAVFQDSDSVVLTGDLGSFEKAKEELNKLYKNFKNTEI